MVFRNSERREDTRYGMTDGSFQSIALSATASVLAGATSIIATRQGYGPFGVGIAALLILTTNVCAYNIQEHTRWAVLGKEQKTRRSGIIGIGLFGLFMWASHGLMKPDEPILQPQPVAMTVEMPVRRRILTTPHFILAPRP